MNFIMDCFASLAMTRNITRKDGGYCSQLKFSAVVGGAAGVDAGAAASAGRGLNWGADHGVMGKHILLDCNVYAVVGNKV